MVINYTMGFAIIASIERKIRVFMNDLHPNSHEYQALKEQEEREKRKYSDKRVSVSLLRKKIRNLNSVIHEHEEELGKLEKKREGLVLHLEEMTENNRELKKEKNFWKKQCKEACERLDSQMRKNEHYQKQSEDLLNKNKNLRIRFENYEKEIDKLKKKIARLEEENG